MRLTYPLLVAFGMSPVLQALAATSPAGETDVVSAQVINALRGTWNEGSESEPFCQAGRNLRRIVASDDRRRLTWELDQPIERSSGKRSQSYSYSVLRTTGVSVLLALDDETRTNPLGEPYVWELVVVAPGRLRWRSTHFEFGVYNKVWLVRCKQ